MPPNLSCTAQMHLVWNVEEDTDNGRCYSPNRMWACNREAHFLRNRRRRQRWWWKCSAAPAPRALVEFITFAREPRAFNGDHSDPFHVLGIW